ncbi:MAG: sulfite exporter TauE/SafE family protein [Leptospiraceae bacterium]|nr:sulfite exporter TauE/SafE family protein [Leptospiraceae bacterium]
MLIKIALLFLGTVLAFWISAICGGGASLILIPVLNLLLPTSVVPFSLTIGTLFSSGSRIVVFRNQINWKIFFWFVPFSIPAVLTGAYLIKFINPVYLQLIVALLLFANLPELFSSKKQQSKEETPYPNFILAIVGFLAGFVSGITGAIGLLFNRFYLKYGLSKEEIVATRAANEIFLHSIKLFIYILLGLYSITAVYLGVIIAVGAVISSYTVKFILPHLSEFLFRKIGYGAMVVSGLILFFSTTQRIVEQDSISVHTAKKNSSIETAIQWRKIDFVLEYSIDDGLEIERAIHPSELPIELFNKYEELLPAYDEILLEKVFKFGESKSYEFYCYLDNKLTKLEFNE